MTISLGAFAQAAKENAVFKKDGKVMIIKEGVTTELKETFVSANGNMFKKDGTVVLNTGSAITLKEGEKMDFSGKVQTQAKPVPKPAGKQ